MARKHYLLWYVDGARQGPTRDVELLLLGLLDRHANNIVILAVSIGTMSLLEQSCMHTAHRTV